MLGFLILVNVLMKMLETPMAKKVCPHTIDKAVKQRMPFNKGDLKISLTLLCDKCNARILTIVVRCSAE